MNDMFDNLTGEELPVSEAAERVRQTSQVPVKYPATLAEALMKAVQEMPLWIKQDVEARAGAVKLHYATLKAILTVVRPILLKNGIRIRQGANPSWQLETGGAKGRLVPVYTELIHTSGDVDRTIIEIPITRLDAQSMGSALSYGRRYSLLAALGLTTDEADDDGAATKTVDITEHEVESQELWGLKEEINALDNIDKLKAWGEKLKASKRADNLDPGEAALLKAHYIARLRTLTDEVKAKAK